MHAMKLHRKYQLLSYTEKPRPRQKAEIHIKIDISFCQLKISDDINK